MSNAFEKSRIATSVSSPASYDFMKSCSVTNSCVSHEYPDLNPWFNDVSTLCLSRCFSMCLQITCSSNLHGTDVSNTGLLFSGAYLSPFFNISDTLAFNQSRGSVPVSMDFWYILVSPGASCLAHSFNILFGMLSGTEALEGFIFLSNFSIPSDRISRSGIDLLVCFVVFGSVLFNSLVNTDLNWFISMCAFRLLSFTSCSLLFSGDTPMLSCFRDLTYFQNGFELLFWCPSIIVSFI